MCLKYIQKSFKKHIFGSIFQFVIKQKSIEYLTYVMGGDHDLKYNYIITLK
jgi:hypothetical protein